LHKMSFWRNADMVRAPGLDKYAANFAKPAGP
jgi:hypothetical protein